MMKSRLPWFTLGVLAFALGISLFPASRDILIYDRDRIVSGEWWRLITGHWIHFTPRHFLFDVMVLGLAGGVIEKSSRGQWLFFMFAGTLFIGSGLLVLEPEMRYYGGLSGLASGAMALVLLNFLNAGRLRFLAGLLLMAICMKIVIELVVQQALFVTHPDSVLLSRWSHALGVVAALIQFGFGRLLINRKIVAGTDDCHYGKWPSALTTVPHRYCKKRT